MLLLSYIHRFIFHQQPYKQWHTYSIIIYYLTLIKLPNFFYNFDSNELHTVNQKIMLRAATVVLSVLLESPLTSVSSIWELVIMLNYACWCSLSSCDPEVISLTAIITDCTLITTQKTKELKLSKHWCMPSFYPIVKVIVSESVVLPLL